MENKIISGNHTFELVEYVPEGYEIWNIGKNMIDGYLPIVQTGGHDGCQVNTNTMKAIKIDEAQDILSAIGEGQNTIKSVTEFIAEFIEGGFQNVNQG